ncbi:MAG: 23S rRNA (guanosine(2251)-2'-O)-methyltransferase RlmB [Mangrovibacterium sp.]
MFYDRKPKKKYDDIIFGIRAIIEAINSGKQIEKVLLKRGQGELYKELFDTIKAHGVPCQHVPIEKLNKITMKNHQGAIAFVSPITFDNIETLLPTLYEEGKNPFILVLDQITDVRNFGAIVRTAECAGVHAIIVPEKGAASINADAMKTSAGALHLVPICRSKDLKGSVRFLQESGLKVVAASEKAKDSYSQVDYTTPVAIVMGSEEFGISEEIIRLSDCLVQIPILGQIQSLNVSVAAGLLSYEVVRQRN